MKTCEMVSLVTAIACEIAKIVPREDVPLVAALLNQTAATLATITVNEDLLHPKSGNTPPEILSPDSEIIDTNPPIT